MNKDQQEALSRLEGDSSAYGCFIVVVAVISGLLIGGLHIPRLISRYTFAFLAKTPWNLILGIILWFLIVVLAIVWCMRDENKRLKEIHSMTGEEVKWPLQ